MRPFEPPSRAGAEWFSAGLAASFPDLGLDDENVSEPRVCNGTVTPGCKVFLVPRDANSEMTELAVASGGADSFDTTEDLKDQVLVFQYKGKFHAVDHVSEKAERPVTRAEN